MEQGHQGPWARRFFTIWIGQAFSLFGSQLVQFALVWWLTLQTGSPIVLAVATIMGLLPQIIISPFAGVFVDRWDRRRVMIAADGSIALCTLLLIIAFAAGSVEVWYIYALLLVRSAFTAFHWPAMQASTTLMVPEGHLARVNGLNSSLQSLAAILAPVLGAVLIAALPMSLVLSVDILTAAMAILPLLIFTIPKPERKVGAERISVMSDMREAGRFIRSWRGAMPLILIFMAVNLITVPATSLLPLLTVQHFHGGAVEYAGLESAFGVGMLVGGIALGAWGGTKRKVVTVMAALILMGLGLGVVGLLPSDGYLLAVIALLLSGTQNPMINGPIMAIMQAGVPPELQGRVLSLLGSGVLAMMPVGLAVAGPMAEVAGVRSLFIVGGLLTSMLGVIAFLTPSIMHIEDRRAEAPLVADVAGKPADTPPSNP